MHPNDTLHNITASRIHHLSNIYKGKILASLKDLEVLRSETIPANLKQESPAKPKPKSKSSAAEQAPHLSKDSLVALTKWKLQRGKFRPALMKFVESNSEAVVQQTTARAYDGYKRDVLAKDDIDDADRQRCVKEAMAILTELKGVGPATASLALSVYDMESVPFFSDELFMWVMSGPGTGDVAANAVNAVKEKADVPVWQGKMKYNVAEYALLYERVQEVRRRVEKEDNGETVRAFDLELAAWVLVKGFADDVEGADRNGEAAGVKIEKKPMKRKIETLPTGVAKKKKK